MSMSQVQSKPSGILARIQKNLVFHEVVAVAFHTFMLFRSFFAPPGEDRSYALAFGFVLWSITLSAIITVRGELLAPGRRRALYYRLAVFAPVVISYFQMMFLLPGLQPTLVDWELYAIDRVIFGETPAVLLEAFNRRPVVEWIAFFYYSYFYMMAAMLIPTLLFDRGQRLRELMVGGVLVATLGHTLYTFVPGAGPWKTLEFTAALDGGFFWGLVQETVSSAGAQLDIFPSLHTAYPTLFSLHAFGNRDRAPFKFLWPVIAFFAANMIVATMFLRWHWAIDVVAGLALAITARAVAVYVARREGKRGQGDDDRQPVWEPLWRIEPDQPRP